MRKALPSSFPLCRFFSYEKEKRAVAQGTRNLRISGAGLGHKDINARSFFLPLVLHYRQKR